MWSSLPQFSGNENGNYVSKKPSVKFVGFVNAQISVKQPPQSFLGTSVIAGHLSPCPTSTFIIDWFPFPPILWSSQLDCEDCGLDSNCKRSGSSSTSISSDLAWIHISIGAVRGLLSFRLISGVTCLSDLHRPNRDQEQELILGRGKVVSAKFATWRMMHSLALDRSRHWDPVIFMQDGVNTHWTVNELEFQDKYMLWSTLWIWYRSFEGL